MSDRLPPIKNPSSPSRKGSPKDCEECGRRFRPWASGGRFCCLQCRSAWWGRQMRSVRPAKSKRTASTERAKDIQDEARAALDNLRKRLDG